ncbi:hypothetical protein MNBD_ALPHA04-2246 [hydrothermal vent metagenome]|uniref:FAD-binding domain-containing protein n=1 Tax=hydrothermal vent metagenome TaxID=652676 RepID=A0A3B0RIU7_9ZZZZ
MTTDNESISENIVLIVGGGPSGCIQALLLAKFGIRTVIVERLTDRSFAPKAHAMNPRSLEICRALGLDFDKIKAAALPREDGGSVYFLPRLDAPILGKVPYERQDDAAFDITPTPLINIAQPDFEEILLETVDACPLIELRRGHEWKSAKEQPGSITSEIETRDRSYFIQSTFVIAADGAGSPVRESLGIGMDGEANVMACMSITFSADLREALKDRLGVIYWLTDPACNCTLLCYRTEELWSLIFLMPYSELDMSLYTEEHCLDLIRKAVGFDMKDLKFKFAVPWTMNSEIAQAYQKNRFFLIGDAAHRFPPTGGLGLNTGILEANNLAWKIAAVIGGWAREKLLLSYERECQPIATQNARQSLANAQRLAPLSELSCPSEIWKSEETFHAWLDEDGRRERIADAVEQQRQHFNSIGLQLGLNYDEEYTGSVEKFVPSAEAGFRLPHAWLTKDGQKISTLDLLDPATFTIISGLENHDWAALCEQFEIPNRTIILNDEYEGAKAWLESIALPEEGALIIRPDGHILIRAADASEQSLSDVKTAFASLFG